MTNTAKHLPTQWEAMPYGTHWSFAYELNGEKREDYDFRVEFNIGVSEYEKAAVIRLLEAAPALLTALKDLLGDQPSVQNFQCIRCGRDYEGIDEWATETGDCPSDDCPTYHARAAIAEATPADTLHSRMWPYSVLLFYPDYANDDGTETYYAFVEAPDPIAAVAEARRQAVAANDCVDIEPDDFAPLLVTKGHRYGEPL